MRRCEGIERRQNIQDIGERESNRANGDEIDDRLLKAAAK
jgi:hypothetical protein